MYIEQIYTDCLAEASYYIESNGEAVVIDPMREPKPYIDKANERGATIKYVFETHFHADFVSGHIDLAKKTGAQIVYGPGAKPSFEIIEATDGQIFNIGDITLEVLHTPGHTLESSCFLLKDADGKNHSVYTGDTLFIGDVGRPDLAVKSDLTTTDLAGMLFDSLTNKILPLEDEVIVYPGHGAGSACGKNMSSERSCSIGNQRIKNYALATTDRDEFIKAVTDGLQEPPQYFPKDVALNKNGYKDIDEVVENGTSMMDFSAFEALSQEDDVLVVDTRDPQTFCKGFVPNAINFGLNGSYAVWFGTLIHNMDEKIILVTEPGKEEEAVIRLARVGYENVIGSLEGGMEAWTKNGGQVNTIDSIDAATFKPIYEGELDGEVLDVRADNEYEAGHLENATHASLKDLETIIPTLDKDQKYYVHCRSGYRSMIATSMMQKAGITNLVELAGGHNALVEENFNMLVTVD